MESRQGKFIRQLQIFFRRHWRRLLGLRQRYQINEAALHLLLAAGVGVIGGFVNLFFYYATESVKHLFLRHPGDPVEVAEMMSHWQRLLTPALGGFCAGLVGDFEEVPPFLARQHRSYVFAARLNNQRGK